MARGALTLEALAKAWRQGAVTELAICGHPHGRVPVPGAAHATQVDRWFFCLYGKREGRWEVVREAQSSALRGRTWWSLDQCLKALEDRQVFPGELRLLPRGPAPADFPALPVDTAPTVSARRKPSTPAAVQSAAARPAAERHWLDDDGPDVE